MTDSFAPTSPDDQFPSPGSGAADALPHELPPVQPPSAGMIVQLFLIPAIIVAAIVGVYALFGRIASQELDWRQLTVDIRSENPHVRWRGALGLAQALDADAQRGSHSQNLAANDEIAEALGGLYVRMIETPRLREEEIKQIEFLSKALGRMQTAEIIVPILRAGVQPSRVHDVRKHSLIGLAMAAGEQYELGRPLASETLVDELIAITREREPLFRHQATYILGLTPGAAAQQRLVELLEDADQLTRVNAAISLARNDRTQGLEVFEELFVEAAHWPLDPRRVGTLEQEAEYFQRVLMLSNAFRAVGQLERVLDAADRERLAGHVDRLADSAADRNVRADALQLTQNLRSR